MGRKLRNQNTVLNYVDSVNNGQVRLLQVSGSGGGGGLLGSGDNDLIAYWDSSESLTGSSAFSWDNSTSTLTVTGSIVSSLAEEHQIAFYDSASALSGNGNFTWENAATALTVSGSVSVRKGDAGVGTPDVNSVLTLEHDSLTYLQFLTNAGLTAGILFGDTDDNDVGSIKYNHFSEYMNFTVNASEAMRINSTGNVGISETTPDTKLHITGGSTDVKIRLESTSIGASAVSQDMAGLEIMAAGMNTTSQYTPAIKFGSTDGQFTTTNPKFGAMVVGRAAETYDTDLKGAMALHFFTTDVIPGASPVPSHAMTIDYNGRVGVGIDRKSTRLNSSHSQQSRMPSSA